VATLGASVRQERRERPALGPFLLGGLAALAVLVGPGRLEAANCANVSTGMVPLPDLGAFAYRGYEGGLYAERSNAPPPLYLLEGIRRAGLIIPREAHGWPDPEGRIVLLSIGMSNTTQEFSEFKRQADRDPAKNPRLVVVDGAQGGQDAERIKDPKAQFWVVVAQRLAAAGVSANQVQVVWLKEAIAGEAETFPADALHLEDDLRAIVVILEQRFPNLQIVYLSSRTYAGYATTALNPEPVAYQSGFAVKWLIEDRIGGAPAGPWLAWGPYLWTDGNKGRSDAFVWTCQDVQSDGTHPSPTSGVQKVAGLLLRFFKAEITAQGWFLDSQAADRTPRVRPHLAR
jgi:hypothetical protein